MGVALRDDKGSLNQQAGHLAVTAGWGHSGQGGVTMPGNGKSILRPCSSEELVVIEKRAEAQGPSAEEALAELGDRAEGGR